LTTISGVTGAGAVCADAAPAAARQTKAQAGKTRRITDISC
jgi:hypothetical protein